MSARPRALQVMAWHPEVPGSDRHAGRIDAASAPDLALVNPDEWGWQDRALCAETDPGAFFPEKGGRAAEAAKRVCASCEVRAECLDFAVSNGIAFGVYGGMDERERRELGPQYLDFRPAPGREGLAA
jgi:WhiB family transcriptional regulator, redox-sensing transcriptional regulator